jgi:hypothetical protein
MTAEKLVGRMEDIRWEPPYLTFQVERHGAFALGSSRGELQSWEINVDEGTANFVEAGYRQVRPMSPRLDVKPLVEEVVALILAGREDERLKWAPDHSRVTVRIGKIIPADGPKETTQKRRRRFARRRQERMESEGWRLVSGTSPHPYEKADKGEK